MKINWNFLGDGGGGGKNKNPSVGGVWIFSGTALSIRGISYAYTSCRPISQLTPSICLGLHL